MKGTLETGPPMMSWFMVVGAPDPPEPVEEIDETLPEDGDAPEELTEEPVDDDVGEPSDTEEDT